ncbi:MAG: GNAT family N-acetyltransferase [Salinibacterium sp.]|nr:MAG: GNAT family N-acetyltransferase [Salinibacterium sp.]
MDVRRAALEDWRECREIRLRALADTPDAFSSTLERELAFPDRVWRKRLVTGHQLLASEGGAIVGTATGIPDEHERGGCEVVAMWVAPETRGRGVGKALIEGLVTWARDASAPSIALWIADGNDAARLLYESCGFTATGERDTIRAGLGQQRMRLPLD